MVSMGSKNEKSRYRTEPVYRRNIRKIRLSMNLIIFGHGNPIRLNSIENEASCMIVQSLYFRFAVNINLALFYKAMSIWPRRPAPFVGPLGTWIRRLALRWLTKYCLGWSHFMQRNVCPIAFSSGGIFDIAISAGAIYIERQIERDHAATGGVGRHRDMWAISAVSDLASPCRGRPR